MLVKHATFRVLSATLAASGGVPSRTATLHQAHRHQFQYEQRPGYLYVRSRAISSRCNDNFDEFPADEIEKAYGSFVGKPVFVNHVNDNHRRARGVILDAALHKDANPDGSPDTWVEVLMEVDAVKFPKLAKAILAGEIDRTSMGTDVAYSLCSFCGKKASTPLEYCQHIPRLKGKRIRRMTASGTQEDVLVREICYGLGFFENSLLVEEPADPTAFFLGVEAGPGVAKAASLNKVAHEWTDEDEKLHPRDKGGEFTEKGGEGEGGSSKLPEPGSAENKLPEPGSAEVEKGERPDPQPKGEDPNNDPDKAIATEPKETTGTGTKEDPVVTNDVEAAAQALVDKKHVQLRHTRQVSTMIDRLAELVKDMDPNVAKTINLCNVTVAGTSLFCVDNVGLPRIKMPQLTAQRVLPGSRAEKELTKGPSGSYDLQPLFRQSLLDRGITVKQDTVPAAMLKASQNELQGAKVASMAQKLKGGGDVQGDRIFTSNDDYIVDGHHRWAAHVAADSADGVIDNTYTMDVDVIDLDIITLLAEANRFALEWGVPPQGIEASLKTASICEGAGQPPFNNKCSKCDLPIRVEDGLIVSHSWSHGGDGGAQWLGSPPRPKLAYGETIAPPQVDTLRDENCPVCAEQDSYDGDKCMVCGFVRPPDKFMDPDLEVARQTDLRQDSDDMADDDSTADLECDNCGATFDSGGGVGGDGGAAPAFIPPGSKPKEEVKTAASQPVVDVLQDASNRWRVKCYTCDKTIWSGLPSRDVALRQVEKHRQEPHGEKTAAAPAPSTLQQPRLPKPKQEAEDPTNQDQKQDDSGGVETAAKAGDTCTTCGQGTLQPRNTEAETLSNEDSKPDPNQAPDDGSKGPVKPPVKASSLSDRLQLQATYEADKEKSMHEKVIASQQARIAALEEVVFALSERAGIDAEASVREMVQLRSTASIIRVADVENPAQPIPDPPSEAPAATTAETLGDLNDEDVEKIGDTAVTDVAADATTSVTSVETVLDAPLDLNEQDPTRPVSGTEEIPPLADTKTETEVRVGDPNNPAVPFKETGWTNTSSQARTYASLRLARLRIQAGIEVGDDLDLAEKIESSASSDEAIGAEIDTLGKVLTTQASRAPERQPVSRSLVPRAAAREQRLVPSMAGGPEPVIQTTASANADDEFAFE